MRLVLTAALLFAGLAESATARTRAVLHPSSLPAPPSVMWIAAHPDDEAIAAPLLGKWCREER
ncbi:MAG TPA: hypothetical protein VNN08_14745, partial [Thermoanaerobaculia bacterium]|nr:hypothetical protein [Thermoanaerobaculia bacterium]